jgi:hypothetical protein
MVALRTAAVIAFIAIVGAFALYLAQRPTVMHGAVMADDMLAELHAKGIKTVSSIVCDDRIPVNANGARFECRFRGIDGSTETWEYTMGRSGAMAGHQIASTGATRHKLPPSGDPWE